MSDDEPHYHEDRRPSVCEEKQVAYPQSVPRDPVLSTLATTGRLAPFGVGCEGAGLVAPGHLFRRRNPAMLKFPAATRELLPRPCKQKAEHTQDEKDCSDRFIEVPGR